MSTFIDASVIVAILAREQGWEELVRKLEDKDDFYISPMVRFEATLALARIKTAVSGGARRPTPEFMRQARDAVYAFTNALVTTEVSITPDIGTTALEVAATYGKIVGHPADLNFGDCFSYACAKALDAALAYKGGDFALTDLA